MFSSRNSSSEALSPQGLGCGANLECQSRRLFSLTPTALAAAWNVYRSSVTKRTASRLSVSYKGGRFQYKCDGARQKYGKPSCQFLSGQRIDAAVVEEFFHALEPAQIDALEKVSAKQSQHEHEREKHLAQEVTRLEYEARRAER